MINAESRHKPLSIEGALAKLSDFCIVVHRRGSLKPAEKKRAIAAINLANNDPPQDNERQQTYQKFLGKVKELVGLHAVVLCAVALGISAFLNMRDRAQLDLPYEIEKIQGRLHNETLGEITNILLKGR